MKSELIRKICGQPLLGRVPRAQAVEKWIACQKKLGYPAIKRTP